jgi:hypothetical protein
MWQELRLTAPCRLNREQDLDQIRDPDPSFISMRIRIRFLNLVRIRVLLLINVTQICTTGLLTLQGSILSLHVSIVSVYAFHGSILSV